MITRLLTVGSLACLLTQTAEPAIWYVSTNGNDSAAGVSWDMAKRTIQAAVDLTSNGDKVLVSNGVYATGGRVVYGAMTNRLAITKAITVESVSGPDATVIRGAWHPGTTNGNTAVRCVYLGTNAVLSGFTLTNGATRTLGDSTREGSGGGVWCANGATVSNCTLSGNSADSYGGGSYYGTLNNCTLSGNSADYGGGSYYGTQNNCIVSGNVANYGGGSRYGTLNNCTLSANSANYYGGGSYIATQNNCIVSGNVANESGGGSYQGILNNCSLSGNSAGSNGGGSYYGTLHNCTLSGNSAANYGGGSYEGTLYNCIVYYNYAAVEANYSGGTFHYSCTTPHPGVTGNITNPPALASASHLAAGSPCIGVGSNSYASGLDIDGEAWGNPPSMGCDERAVGSITGALSVTAMAAYTNVASGFAVPFVADIAGAAAASVWNFPDGTAATNQPYISHAFGSTGTCAVILTAFNGTYPAGVSATVTVRVAAQVVHYVNLGNATPVAPFTTWATAATNIQDAVDEAAQGGALVLVTNGVYETGGRVVYGAMTNRVAITKPVTVASVNGPDATVIRGTWHPDTRNGETAVRCVYLGPAAVLSGFTLTNGATQTSGDSALEKSGGGVWCATGATASNCTLSGNAAISGGGSYQGTLNNCTLSGNSANVGGGSSDGILNNCTLSGNSAHSSGGGSYQGTLNNCTLSDNSADSSGGGSYWVTLNNCTLSRNSAGYYGGGSYYGTLNNCTLSGNSATNYGGGSYYGALNNCTLSGNSAYYYGGGSYYGTLNNCTLSGNSANYNGGGSYYGTLNNCTLSGNSANYYGGGSYSGTLNNCIVYYNDAGIGANYSGGTFRYSCTTPDPGGTGNITDPPALVSASHLAAGSPCIGAGSSSYASGLDIDREAWGNPPSMGCDEPAVGSITGALSVTAMAAYTNVASGFTVPLVADIAGAIAVSVWSFPDGTAATNQPYISHAFGSTGTYAVILTAFNGTYPAGVSATVTVQVAEQMVHYVNLGNATSVAPFTAWATAATNIQEAVDEATQAGALVLVTNGVYATGGRVVYGAMTNRVAITKPLTVVSVNGPGASVIRGAWHPGTTNGNTAVRCVYLGPNAVLSGFTLTNGATRTSGDLLLEQSGGGAWCAPRATISNCTLFGNSAKYNGGGSYQGTLNRCTLSGNTATHGGGAYAYQGTLNSCILSGNSAGSSGGGSYEGTLNNCTLSGNAAINGGGAYGSTLSNCIVYYNDAAVGANYNGGTLGYSCTTPDPGGAGNIVSVPQFVDAGSGNFHLQLTSPCIDRGDNASVTGAVDLDGNPRIIGRTVDMGAYEFTGGTTASGIPWPWLLDYDLATDGTADGEDVDGDGQTAYAEHRAGTHPWDPNSVLGLSSAGSMQELGSLFPIFRWASVSGRVYRVELSTNLLDGFTTILADDVPATEPENTVTDRTDAASFKAYRVEVK